MSNNPYPDDAASFSEAESSEEELDHAMSDEDCEVCRSLRLPVPVMIETTYAELRRTAADGCELCELLQRIGVTACTDSNTIIRDNDSVYVYPRLGRGVGYAATMSVMTRSGISIGGSLSCRPLYNMSCIDCCRETYGKLPRRIG